MSMTCGEATMRLLARYGVTTVFGIPGVHTLDMCRGMSGDGNAGGITHVQSRNEQGAGFMAEGWARATSAVVIASTAGKGIVPDDHPLSLSASTVRPEVRRFLPEADVILAVGTELSETDSFVERMDLRGDIIRVDIDSSKMSDVYPARLGVVAHAAPAMASLRAALGNHVEDRTEAEARVRDLRAEIADNLSSSERQHARLLALLHDIAPADTIWSGDACQLVYTGAFAFPTRATRGPR